MVLKVYSVFDSKAEAYNSPFLAITRGAAIRAVTDSVNDPKSVYHRWPADFTLFEIGEFDDSSGRTTMNPSNINCGCLIEFVESQSTMPNQLPFNLNPNGKHKELSQ